MIFGRWIKKKSILDGFQKSVVAFAIFLEARVLQGATQIDDISPSDPEICMN